MFAGRRIAASVTETNSHHVMWSSFLLRRRSAGRHLRLLATVVVDEDRVTLKESPSTSTITTTRVHSALSHERRRCIEYSRGWAWQQFLLSRRLALRRSQEEEPEDHDTVLLFEHAPVYTLGRGADENHLTFLQEGIHDDLRDRLSRSRQGAGSARLSVDRRLLEEDLFHRTNEEAVDILSKLASPVVAPNGAPIYRVERGGEVTFHGPGQLVVYPLFDLKREPYQQDLHWFLRMVEEVIIQSLRHYDIEGCRDQVNTGVWVNEHKIAAVGVSSSRWITTHGFALNVCPGLTYFDTSIILPCGIEGRGVTSIAEIVERKGGRVPSVQEVSTVVLQSLQDVFGIDLHHGSALR